MRTNQKAPASAEEILVARADALLATDAAAQGLTVHKYSQKYGIVGPTQERKLRRHEIVPGLLKNPEYARALRANMENRTTHDAAELGNNSLPGGSASIITARPQPRGTPRRRRESE